MDTFYVLVQFSPNPHTGDRVTFGMIARFSNQYWVTFSPSKLKALKQLSPWSYNSLSWVANQIEAKVKEENLLLQRQQSNQVLSPDFVEQPFLEPEFFTQLSEYMQGGICFTKPQPLEAALDERKAIKLFRQLVDSGYNPEPEETTPTLSKKERAEAFRAKIRRHLIEPVRNKVDTYFSIDQEFNPAIYFELELDCIGSGKELMIAKSFDFAASYQSVDALIGHYSYLINLLNSRFGSPKANRFYLIADAPEDAGPRVSRAWEALNINPLIKVVPIAEAESVAQIMLDAGLGKFSKMLEK